MKHLIDVVSPSGRRRPGRAYGWRSRCYARWSRPTICLWRVGGYAAHRTFVAVTGDIRRDLFGHLSGHSPSYFAERLPGALASRITATANAAFTVREHRVVERAAADASRWCCRSASSARST